MKMNSFGRKGFGSFVKTFLLLFAGIFLGICFALNSDSESFLYLQSTSKHSKDAIKEKFYKVKETNVATNSNSASVGSSGLNLLLIAKLNESYIKDLLSLYSDNEQGKINNYKFHMSVQALLGMQVNETNTYSGTILPQTYLPFKNGKVVWNTAYKGLSAKQMTLRFFGNKEWNTIDGGNCSWLNEGGGFYTPWQAQLSQMKAKANISSDSNSNRSTGEHYYLPDNLASLDRRLSEEAYRIYDVDLNKLKTSTLGCVMSCMNNRGSGGAIMEYFGFPYNGNGNSKASSVFKKLSEEDKIQGFNQLANLYDSYQVKSDLTSIVKSEYGRMIAVIVAAHNDDWYFGNNVMNYVGGGSHKNTFIRTWKTLYPDEENLSYEKMKEMVEKKSMNLNDAIKMTTGEVLSTSDTKRIYDTSSDYNDGPYSWNDYTIYHVSKDYKIKYSDGKEHPLVGAYDLIHAGQAASVCIIGPVLYANLLKMGGLSDVDPTNPSTYLANVVNGQSDNVNQQGNSSQNTDTYIPSGSEWFFKYNLKTSDLNSNRIVILRKCESYFNIPYSSSGIDLREHEGADYIPKYIDPSTYVWRVYNASGFKLNTGLDDCTISSLSKDKNLKRISWEERKPGDILISRDAKSAGIYVGYSDGKVGVAMSTGSVSPSISLHKWITNIQVYSNSSGKDTVKIGKSSNTSDTYILYRYSGVDDNALPYQSALNNTESDNVNTGSGGKLQWGSSHDKTVTSSSIRNSNSDIITDNVGNQYTKGEKLGTFVITGYCTKCNTPRGSRATASGRTATAGISVAVKTSQIKMGTYIVIGDHVYRADDKHGNRKYSHVVDVFFGNSHGAEPLIKNVPVYRAIKK